MLGDELRCIAKQHAKNCNEVERKQMKLWTNMNKKKDEAVNYTVDEKGRGKNKCKEKKERQKGNMTNCKVKSSKHCSLSTNDKGKTEAEVSKIDKCTDAPNCTPLRAVSKIDKCVDVANFVVNSPDSKIDKCVDVSNFVVQRPVSKIDKCADMSNFVAHRPISKIDKCGDVSNFAAHRPVSKIDKCGDTMPSFSTNRGQNRVITDPSKGKSINNISTLSDREESELNFSTIKSKTGFHHRELKRPFSSAQDFLVFQYFDGKVCSPLEKLYINETNKHTDLIRYDKLRHGKTSTVVLSTKNENKGRALPSLRV